MNVDSFKVNSNPELQVETCKPVPLDDVEIDESVPLTAEEIAHSEKAHALMKERVLDLVSPPGNKQEG